MASKITPAPVDVLADFKVSTKRAPMYAAVSGAKRAAVAAVSEVAYVTRGAHSKTGAPVLLVVDGSTQTALSLGAIGAAIAAGVITRAEIDALLGQTPSA